MTAQEAKQRLERIWKDYTSAYDTVSIEDLMAFDMATNSLGAIEQIQWERDMAIKQLHDLGYGLGEKPREEVKKSNQEVEKSSDKLIKASDAVDVVAKHSALYGNGEISTDEGETLLYDIMSEIMNLPSAQPERKIGKWKHIWNAPDGTYKGMCENCGFTHVFFDGHDSQYNFCPECGSYNGGDSNERT